MSQRIHISLPVADLGAAVGFYRHLFGSEPSKERTDYANFRLQAPPIHLALVLDPAAASGPGVGRHHFGVELPSADDLSVWTRRLEDGGQSVREETEAQCCYAKADKTWVNDPDGHAWELWVRTGESERLAPPEGECCEPETACCG